MSCPVDTLTNQELRSSLITQDEAPKKEKILCTPTFNLPCQNLSKQEHKEKGLESNALAKIGRFG